MNKEIKVSTFLIILGSLVFIELLILVVIIPAHNHKILRGYCKTAICNNDASICFNYDLDGDTTIVTWQRNCQNVKK